MASELDPYENDGTRELPLGPDPGLFDAFSLWESSGRSAADPDEGLVVAGEDDEHEDVLGYLRERQEEVLGQYRALADSALAGYRRQADEALRDLHEVLGIDEPVGSVYGTDLDDYDFDGFRGDVYMPSGDEVARAQEREVIYDADVVDDPDKD